jgi:transposase
MVILPESLAKLVCFITQIDVELHGSAFTLDTGFDSQKNKDLIMEQKMIPVIYPNRRNTKDPIAIACLFSCFNKELYKERYKVERTFGWQDTYRKLAISYDRLEEIRLGSRNLAYAMINFRVTFNSF